MLNMRPIGVRMSRPMARSYQKRTLRTTASTSTATPKPSGVFHQGRCSSFGRGVSE